MTSRGWYVLYYMLWKVEDAKEGKYGFFFFYYFWGVEADDGLSLREPD